MSGHVLLNLSNELGGKEIKCEACLAFYLFFATKKIKARLMMQNGDPRDGLFYPTLTLMMDSYNLGWLRTSRAGVPCDAFHLYYICTNKELLHKICARCL